MANEDLYHLAHYLDDAYSFMMWKKEQEDWQQHEEQLNQPKIQDHGNEPDHYRNS